MEEGIGVKSTVTEAGMSLHNKAVNASDDFGVFLVSAMYKF